MRITEDEVRRVAELAQLALTEDEVHRMAQDMDGILGHIEKLNELNTDGVEPMAQVLYDPPGDSEDEKIATLREDVVRPSLRNADAVANAPTAGAGYFKVPKVIERD